MTSRDLSIVYKKLAVLWVCKNECTCTWDLKKFLALLVLNDGHVFLNFFFEPQYIKNHLIDLIFSIFYLDRKNICLLNLKVTFGFEDIQFLIGVILLIYYNKFRKSYLEWESNPRPLEQSKSAALPTELSRICSQRLHNTATRAVSSNSTPNSDGLFQNLYNKQLLIDLKLTPVIQLPNRGSVVTFLPSSSAYIHLNFYH